jgi:prophage DNA circulation protein
MEPLQKQVTTLSHKVDELYQVIAQLSSKVSDALSECRLAPVQVIDRALAGEGIEPYSAQSYSSFNSAMKHKDVLTDGTLDTHRRSAEKELTPEIQIQRLTAQLTAAYNRIAALEEQLIAKRIH